MCNAACIDEATNRVHIEMSIFSRFIDISETLSSCLSRSFMFWTTFRKCSRFPEDYVSERPLESSEPYSRFPEACWTEHHPDFAFLSSQVQTWESLVLPGTFGVTRIILSHRFALSRNETTCFCCRRWWTGRRAFMRSFRHFRLLLCGKTRMAIGKVAAGKCGVVHGVN